VERENGGEGGRDVESGGEEEEYEARMRLVVANVADTSSLWATLSWLERPTVGDIFLFRDGVRPLWEDAANRRGGKWQLRLPKALAAKVWEDLVLAFVGGAFTVGDELVGIAWAPRYSEDSISVWNRTAHDSEAKRAIFDVMNANLTLIPHLMRLEYKPHEGRRTTTSVGGKLARPARTHERAERIDRADRPTTGSAAAPVTTGFW
jgi:translation initiation factor 4E